MKKLIRVLVFCMFVCITPKLYCMDFFSFYLGFGTDDKGRSLASIHNYTYQHKEAQHDFIQRIFPNLNPSEADPSAPRITQKEVDRMKKNPTILANLRKSFDTMLDFYGIKYNTAHTALERNMENEKTRFGLGGWNSRSANWLTKNNHNYLRITRIITCLHLFGLKQEATLFFDFLNQLYQDSQYKKMIGKTTFDYWFRAHSTALIKHFNSDVHALSQKASQ
ncbi:MAG: Opioid growth factor receptor (OGFr) conserved region [candidate division TM6 bacterium GW2011_GWE2_41_16]|nr:MAG: Opioid growth factor receptor (OGFr) conserved region [candidate division TM6 bacterium GW2011_GWE2_41_16]